MREPFRHRTLRFALPLLGFLLVDRSAFAQPKPDQQAAMLLDAGRKAYNDRNLPFAADRFREFIAKFGGHKDANAARFGLGLTLLDLQPIDYQKALEAFNPPAADKNFPDQPLAIYYVGVSQRGLGHKELAQGIARPNEMPQRTNAANAKFNEAMGTFLKAREAFEKKKPPEPEWAARARCDQAEMELRLGKIKEARATVEVFAKDAALAKSQLRPLGLYYHGVACFQQADIPNAAKSLGQLAPFGQPFGPHAQYLMGRIHQSQDEKAEAAAAYEAVLAGWEKQKKAAIEALKPPDKFKNDPWEKARLEQLVKAAPPDYVAGSVFQSACLQYEAGKFGAALAGFQAFAKEYASSPLKEDALLRAGFCLVQTKQYAEALKNLQPLGNVQRLADQAHYWIGKAQVGLALASDPKNTNARTQAFNTAIASLRTAADRANQLASKDPGAKNRRAEILLEMADAQLLNKQARDAARSYETIWNEKLLPKRQEETLQRIVSALHLAAEYNGSDARINEFKQKFPQSPLLPLVLFRGAENAYARAEQLAKQKNAGAKAGFAAAGKKYEEVIARFPEFERVNRARYGLGLCSIAADDYEKAATTFEKIPAPERNGDLSPVNFMLADCLIRTAPAKAEDALQDNMLREKLGNAATLLASFVAANPKAPETPDALLKLGFCQKRIGIQLAPGNERNDALAKARQAFERINREFAASPINGAAALERAKVMVLQGDKGGALNSLGAFRNNPLAQSKAAPLAYITLATLQREQNQAANAAATMQEARQKFEGSLNGDPDPARKAWVQLLRYHHGVALFEAGKPVDARQVFDQVIQQSSGKPIGAEAALRAGQCYIADARKKIEALEKEKAKGNLKPAQIVQIESKIKFTKGEFTSAAKLLERRASDFKQALAQHEARARMLYDAAWAYKTAGDDPSNAYKKLIAEFASLSMAVEARLELAELLAEKKKPDEAIQLLKEALDAEPTDKPTPPETTERIRIRLGSAYFDKKDLPAAQAQFDAVAANEKSPHRGLALYRAGECLMAQKKWEEAAKKLAIFRDNGAFHNIPKISDRALLRLGHALSELKQWAPSRQAFETLVARYGDGNTWAVDARYGIGWTFQNAGQYVQAVNAYAQVTQKTTDDRAGRAYLQIGLCRAAQKKWADAGKAFATVYYGYDLPDLRFAAMIEHARVHAEQKAKAEAVKLLERVVKEAPKDGDWSKAAAEMLAKVKK